jgi:hypothetical protein
MPLPCYSLVAVLTRAFSQYSGEKEVTFPPFTCLEADGDPRIERGPQGEVVIFPLTVGPDSF